MKSLIRKFVILALLPAEVFARQSVSLPSSYSRQLRGLHHTWSFRENVLGVKYKDQTPVTVQEVRSFIVSAVSQWSDAANQEGERIQFEEARDYDSAELKILFAPYSGDLGSTASGYIWIADSGHAWPPRLHTTILHEMGHVFLGSGHHGDGVMSQIVGNGHPSAVFTGLGSNELRWTLEIYNPQITFIVQNFFGDGSTCGRVVVDSVERIIPSDPGYVKIEGNRASTFPHTLVAINRQSVGGFFQEFIGWSGSATAKSLSLQIDTVNNARYKARFKNIYNLQIENDFDGVRNKGFIKINDTTYSLPKPAFEVLQDSIVRLEAPDQISDCMYYRFFQWSDGATANPYFLVPSGHCTLTARYKAVRALPPPDLVPSCEAGQSVRITWSEHPNAAVTKYRLWRRLKTQGGNPSLAECLATLERGTTSWADPNYVATAGHTHEVIRYGVQSFYAVTSTYSEVAYTEVFGRRAREDLTSAPDPTSARAPTTYRVHHYPNPAGPSTNIVCELPFDAMVTLEVYDLMGRKVRSLLQEKRYAGYHTIVWNGRDESGNILPAGVYFYRLQAHPIAGRQAQEFVQTRKIILMRR